MNSTNATLVDIDLNDFNVFSPANIAGSVASPDTPPPATKPISHSKGLLPNGMPRKRAPRSDKGKKRGSFKLGDGSTYTPDPALSGATIAYKPGTSPIDPLDINPTASDEELSQDLAKALQGAIDTGLKKGLEAGIELAQAKTKIVLEMCETRIKDLSQRYARPMPIEVKIGDLPTTKLSNRASPLLESALRQSLVGQAGGKWFCVTGPAGCGKTMLAHQVAESLKIHFYHLNFTEGMSESWLWGRQTPQGFQPGPFWLAIKNGGVFLADEMDAGGANVILSLNTALANGHATNPYTGEEVTRHKDFIFIAAMNTNGKGGTGVYNARGRLDAASLSRLAQFQMGYDKDLEKDLCPDSNLLSQLWDLRSYLEKEKSRDFVSTRCILNAYKQSKAGFSYSEIFRSLSESFDDRAKDYAIGMGEALAVSGKGFKEENIPF